MLNLFNKKKNNLFTSKFVSKSSNSGVIKKYNEIYETRHFPPANQEWYNSIYLYKHNEKWLPIIDKIVNNLLKIYYNLSVKSKFKKRSIKQGQLRFTTNKVFISKPEVKHINDKAVITIHVYNRKKKYLVLYKNYLLIQIKQYENLLKKNWNLNKKKKENLKKIFLQNYKKILKQIKNNKTKSLLKKLKFKKSLSLYYNDIYKFLRLIILYVKNEKLLNLNNLKYKDFFIFDLKNLISKIYNKKVKFKIINLKQLQLNRDIFIQSVAIKIRNRKNRLLRVLKRTFHLIKLPYYNKNIFIDNILNKNFLDKYNNLNNNWLISSVKKNKDTLDELLSKIFISEKKSKLKLIKKNNLEKNVLNYIEHKKIYGVKLESAGRLTRRLIASRSVFKFRYKGSLKNRDSSYNNVSAVILKGYIKSNIQYTKINSKTRNGCFGLKGWISSY